MIFNVYTVFAWLSDLHGNIFFKSQNISQNYPKNITFSFSIHEYMFLVLYITDLSSKILMLHGRANNTCRFLS